MKNKLTDLVTVFLIQLVLTLPFYIAEANALTISNIKVAKVTSNSASVEWNTDANSDSRVKYGKTTALGFNQKQDDFVQKHSVTVFNGINSETNYYFAVESVDANGVTSVNNNSDKFYTFKTIDITPPSQVTGLKLLSAAQNFIFLYWTNSTALDLGHYTIYRSGLAIANSTVNSFNDTSLEPGRSFNYKVSATDSSGNEGQQSDTLIASTGIFDTTVPEINNIDVSTPTDLTARIKWNTNENSTSEIRYGINTTDKIKSSNELKINHSVTIDGLTKGLKYIYYIRSCDASNNCGISQNQTFTAGIDTTPPFFNLSVPRYVNKRVIDLAGTTEPFSSVTLFVNDINIPKRSYGNNEIGSSGRFLFSQIQLNLDNIIKILIVDKSGNKNEKTFEVGVDTEEPAVKLNNITSITAHSNFTISGSVSEPVTINIFVDTNVNETAIPSKIANLNATKIGQNSVELHWGESKDNRFDHYVVYRSDIGPIAVTRPSNYNLFIDAIVDSDKSYTYQISAVNSFGKEGPKSEPVTAATLAGGLVLNIKPEPASVNKDSNEPMLKVNASNEFNFGIRLDKGDGHYRIKLVFEDKAQNAVVIEKKVLLDTKKPEIRIISPPQGAFVFENVAHEVDVVGKTKPNARVHLFIDRTPFSFYGTSAEITGFPNEVQNTPEARLDIELRDLPGRIDNVSEEQLDARCRISGIAASCRSGADRSVTADSEGNFRFEKVDLSASFAGALRITEVPVTQIRDVNLNQEAKDNSRKTTLILIATDQSGLRGVATENINIGTCWSGNQSWDVIPIPQAQYPIFLSTSRMSEGSETISFIFNYSYLGRGTNAKIQNVGISKACSSREISDPRFNISCLVLPSGNSPIQLNKPDNTLSYSAIPLNRLPNMDKFLENDWKSFLNAINKELTFPLKLKITYTHDILDETGTIKTIKEVQTTCQQVSYVIDSSLIDPRKVLPDWLLYDFVDYMQSSIKALTKVQEQIDKVVDYVAIGCLFSFFAHAVYKIYRTWIDISNEKGFNRKNFAFNIGILQDNIDCEAIKKSIEGVYGVGNARLKYYSDPDLKKCFSTSYNAWQTETKFYEWQRWSCDRIFGHAAPSKWTETVSDEDLYAKVEQQNKCEKDQSVQGQPLRADKCINFASKYPKAKDFGIDKRCVLVQFEKNQHGLYTIGNLVAGSEGLYQLDLIDGLTSRFIYAVKDKRSDDYYITEYPQTCEELCGQTGTDKTKQHDVVPKSKAVLSSQSKSQVKKVPEKLGLCITAQKCIDIAADQSHKAIIDGEEKEVSSAYRKGYTQGCFYESSRDNPDIVSDTSLETRLECCCINSKGSVPESYYQPEDVTRYNGMPVHESKSTKAPPPIGKPDPNKEGKDEFFSDMKWSYRYSIVKFEAQGTDKNGNIVQHNKYNPNRYIDGRDLPSCFGQDNLFYSAIGKKEEVLAVNPFRQHTAAMQCAYLTGINQRLQLFKNIMTAVSNCLIEVRKDGKADAGVCKELFTQHVCGLIWQVVNFLQSGCDAEKFGVNIEASDDNVANKIKQGLKGITQGLSEAQQEFNNEYGNAKLSNLLGIGEGGVARKVCLAAFGYDWDLNAKNLIDAAYATPFATLVQAVTRSREFLSIDPVSQKPRYEYRASWIINPGCDLDNYNVQLACVGRKQLAEYPNSVNCGAVGAPSIGSTGAIGTSNAYSNCDCIGLDNEQLAPFYSGTRARQNQLIEKDRHFVPDSLFRYDHLKFTLRTDRKIPANIQQNCFPTGYDKGVFYFPIIDKTPHDIADCTVNPLSGQFSCSSSVNFFSKKGNIQIIETTINGVKAEDQKELKIGDSLDISLKTIKTGKDKCLRVSITPDVIEPQYSGITLDGISELPPIRITDSLRIAGRIANVNAPNIDYRLILQPQEPVFVAVSFIDNAKGDSKNIGVYSDDDQISIDGVILESQRDSNGKISLISKIYANGDTKIAVEPLLSSESSRVANYKIIIEKKGAKIEIIGAAYNQVVQGNPAQLSQTITINPQQPGTQTQQQKTILIEMFNILDGSESYTSPDDCNLNEKVYEKPYSFIVGEKGADVSQKDPLIQNPILSPQSEQFLGNPIVVTTKITHASGIIKADALLSGPSQSIGPQPMQRGGDTWTTTFSTTVSMNIGDYEISINAESQNGKKSTKTTKYKLKQPK